MSREITSKDFVRERLKIKGQIKADEMYDKVSIEINRLDREIQKLLVNTSTGESSGQDLPKAFICKFSDVDYINNLKGKRVQVGIKGVEHECDTKDLVIVGGPK